MKRAAFFCLGWAVVGLYLLASQTWPTRRGQSFTGFTVPDSSPALYTFAITADMRNFSGQGTYFPAPGWDKN